MSAIIQKKKPFIIAQTVRAIRVSVLNPVMAKIGKTQNSTKFLKFHFVKCSENKKQLHVNIFDKFLKGRTSGFPSNNSRITVRS